MIRLFAIPVLVVLFVGCEHVYPSSSLKRSGYVDKNAFSQARHLAASERLVHFIAFAPDDGEMAIYKDSNNNNTFEPAEDKMVGPAIKLEKGVVFVSGDNCPPLFKLKTPYIKFKDDGSVIFPDNVTDLPLSPQPTDSNTDIVLAYKDKRPGRVFLDIESSGIIRKIIYKPE
jgi:hypothetical protein